MHRQVAWVCSWFLDERLTIHPLMHSGAGSGAGVSEFEEHPLYEIPKERNIKIRYIGLLGGCSQTIRLLVRLKAFHMSTLMHGRQNFGDKSLNYILN